MKARVRQMKRPGRAGVGFVVIRRCLDAVHVPLVGIGRIVAPMRQRQRVTEFVMQDAHRGAAADTGEASGLPAGEGVVNIQVIQAPAARSSRRPLQGAIPCQSGGLLAIKSEAGLDRIFRLGFDAFRLGADVRAGRNDQFREDDMAQTPHFQIRHRPLGLELGKGSAGVVAVRVREILHVEHRHDDLGGRADLQVGERGAGARRRSP